MKAEEMFAVWAPDDARWSPWVKPVLFAFMPVEITDAATDLPVHPAWLPKPGATAFVVDLPGTDAVRYGVALAQTGYQPVPVFTAVPGPPGPTDSTQVDVWPLVRALQQATALVQAAQIPGDAPPAFLLHAPRRVATRPLAPGCFDNRSVVLTTDFPSATTLMGHGIEQVVLLQAQQRAPVPSDLAHVLRHWQDAGLTILGASPDITPPVPLKISKPSAFGLAWYRILEAFGLRRHVLGGFGGEVPDAGGGG